MALATTMNPRVAVERERPNDGPREGVLGWLIDAVMIFVQFVGYCIQTVLTLAAPLVLLLAIFPVMLAVAVLVMLFGSIFGAFQ